MATKKKATPVLPFRQRPVELSEVDKAKLGVYVGYAEFAKQQMHEFVASVAKKYDLKEEDVVMADGTIVRKEGTK